jgi:hypothetical protein
LRRRNQRTALNVYSVKEFAVNRRCCLRGTASGWWLRRATLAGLLLTLPVHPAARGKATTASAALLLSAEDSHIRVGDARLRRVLEQAAEGSPTLHGLVSRLQASDVVAYVEYDGRQRSRLAGHLTFISSTPFFRYVRIRVAYFGVARLQAAVVGHELRHAVEVADVREIVDAGSLAREFARIGFPSRVGGTSGSPSYETRQAQDAGEQILRELTNSTE